MREAAIQRAVVGHWRHLGLPDTLVAAIPNAYAHGQPGLTKGLLDLIVLGGSVGFGFIELKTDNGIVSQHQADFIDLCKRLGIPAVITYGRDEPIRILEEWGVVRKSVGVAA